MTKKCCRLRSSRSSGTLSIASGALAGKLARFVFFFGGMRFVRRFVRQKESKTHIIQVVEHPHAKNIANSRTYCVLFVRQLHSHVYLNPFFFYKAFQREYNHGLLYELCPALDRWLACQILRFSGKKIYLWPMYNRWKCSWSALPATIMQASQPGLKDIHGG